jgi:serine O-acetyltransferase
MLRIEAILLIRDIIQHCLAEPPMKSHETTHGVSGNNREPSIRSFRAFRDYVGEDYQTNNRRFWSPGFQALAAYRLGVWVNNQRPGPLRFVLRRVHWFGSAVARNVYGIELYPTTIIGRRLAIIHQHGIVIHPRAVIGDDCVIRQGATLGGLRPMPGVSRAPTLGDRVEVGAGAMIVGKIMVGDDVVIGPNAVVMTNVPSGSIVASPQARIMRPPPRRIDSAPEAPESAAMPEQETR